MMKKKNILVIAVIIITCFAGCGGGGGGGSSSGGGDKPVANTDILNLLNDYKIAVEAYQVDGMLDCLDSGSFSLTINEGSYGDTKDYDTLKSELEDDQDSQAAWRKLPSEDPDGHNYKLELKLGTAMSGNETSSGAVVKQTFEVWESSEEVNPAIKTDSGNIVWTLAQITGEWKATAMIINYDIATATALAAKGLAVSGSKGKGFGFSKIEL